VVTGEAAGGVAFALNGRPVATKTLPPYSLEVDLGAVPRTHVVTATALGAGGRVLARDEVVLNAGPHRFAVRLVEPAPGRRYTASLRAQAEVDVPEGDRLDRVELFLNDTPVATLYQAPFAHPVLLPSGLGAAYVRAVAYLADGHSAEDLVFVNAPENLDQIDVRLVELFTSALDRRGRPVDDLGREEFLVREEGEVQELRRFERVRELPIWAGLLLDRSSSMAEEIREVAAGALAFFEQVLGPKDRAAVLTFNHQPELAVRFTGDPEVLAGGVAGITAEGGTALYDSLVEALYYFSGVNGKRALLVITDGEDQGSRYSFDEALDYARRTGVAVYTIGLGLPAAGARFRMQLQRLATETGGRSFLISRASELERVYDSIEEELRSQYLLAYQSTYSGRDSGFREVEVEVKRPGVSANTIRGYFP
jgi:VWFA-related protein